MHGEPSHCDDSALLARWALDGSEAAFAELVRNYERLVLGAALRRTGDAELAREVAQQVFATLAAKARLLLGRTNLAGWLYRAASHIGARAARGERQRRTRIEAFAAQPAPEDQGTDFSALEDALAALGEGEREALVLHYFQDLSYPEIAAALGIQEAAARKRVWRAMQRLAVQLRRRGLGGSTVSLLAGAAAQQCGAPAGLASAALAASATTSPPAFLVITTLMSHSSIKIAASAAALVVTPLFFQWEANADLRREIARVERPAISPAPAKERTTLVAEIAAQRAARMAAENRAAELVALREKIEREVVVSLGTVEHMAKKLAGMFKTMAMLDPDAAPPPESGSDAFKEREKRAQEMAESLPEVMTIIRDLPKLERDPEKAARFYATMLGESAGLSSAERGKVEAEFASWLRALQQEGLALAQRPKGSAKDWDERRNAETRRLFGRLEGAVGKLGQPGLERVLKHLTDLSGGGYEFLTAEIQP